jgi:Tol biopolymer transport system component
MTLKNGTRLGPYEITAPIGAGGMGEVYRATDTKLKRDVAIKVLPEEVARDQERLARFEREAHVLASLNHPHIAAIYGLEESDGVPCLVLELVEGQTLAERLKEGALPVEKALDLARQIASALEAAHEKGVIHRDLKPANIKITPEGTAKVLDFGLAKAFADEAAEISGDASLSPTLTMATRAGVILGTAAYMSPEQARGKAVDKRTDIWAFGCVLYEILTGRQAFPGETASDAIARILEREPDWQAIPHSTPPRVRDLLERCLEKAPSGRLRDIGDARIELERSCARREWTVAGVQGPAAVMSAGRVRWRGVAMLTVGILVGAAAVMVGTFFSTGPASRGTARLSFQAPPTQRLFESFFAISPDGRTFAYTAYEKGPGGGNWISWLYLRGLDGYETTAIEGSEGVAGPPVFSPDGEQIAWVAPLPTNPALHLIAAPVDLDAPPRVIGEWPRDGAMHPSMAWLPDGHIAAVTGSPGSGLGYTVTRFPSDGRPPAAGVPLRGFEIDWVEPLGGSVLPDGKTLLAEGYIAGENKSQLFAAAIDAESGETRIMAEDAHLPTWFPTGHLLFARRNVLMAVPFDPERIEVTGGPATLVEATAAFALSSTGTLVYRSSGAGEAARRVAVFDAENRVEDWSADRRPFRGLSVSPDGQRVALWLADPEEWDYQIWTSEIDRPHLRPLAKRDCWIPVWAPDGEQLIYWCDGVDRIRGVYVSNVAVGGEPRLVLESEAEAFLPTSVSSDGTHVLLNRSTRGLLASVLAPLIPLEKASESLRVIVPDQSDPPNARFSPDGRWIAYVSSRAGRPDVMLAKVGVKGQPGPEIVVSTQGGTDVIWSKTKGSTHELLYVSPSGQLMAITVEGDSGPTSSGPRQILDLHERGIHRQGEFLALDTMPGGGYLAILFGEDEQSNRFNVVLGFDEELRRRTSAQR